MKTGLSLDSDIDKIYMMSLLKPDFFPVFHGPRHVAEVFHLRDMFRNSMLA